MKNIGTRIKARLRQLSMTQYELAKNAGLTEACVSMIVTGKRSPHAESIKAICTVLQCSADYLLGIKVVIRDN